MQQEMNLHRILTTKDVQNLCQCGEKQARTLINDIKQEFSLKRYVLLIHFKKYFHLQ